MAQEPPDRETELFEERQLTRRVGNAVGATFGQFPSETAPEVKEALKPDVLPEGAEVQQEDHPPSEPDR